MISLIATNIRRYLPLKWPVMDLSPATHVQLDARMTSIPNVVPDVDTVEMAAVVLSLVLGTCLEAYKNVPQMLSTSPNV